MQMMTGYEVDIFRLSNDVLVGVDTTYGPIPNLPQPPVYPFLTANVIMPMTYPNFNLQVGLSRVTS